LPLTGGAIVGAHLEEPAATDEGNIYLDTDAGNGFTSVSAIVGSFMRPTGHNYAEAFCERAAVI
jgi:hypothetical protein